MPSNFVVLLQESVFVVLGTIEHWWRWMVVYCLHL